ncbi:hypothetical protein NC651_018564 [Populus alba x Populus x berolinensis]|nr:hypothetical protein NC651_018564 [Populus alba x Populus x berolinensis]
MDLAAKLSSITSFCRKNPHQPSSTRQNRLHGATSSSSIMDLLVLLSATLAAYAPDPILSQISSQSIDSERFFWIFFFLKYCCDWDILRNENQNNKMCSRLGLQSGWLVITALQVLLLP